jgi:hypothetical protein
VFKPIFPAIWFTHIKYYFCTQNLILNEMKGNDKIKTIVIDDESHWQLILSKMVGKVSDLSLEGAFSSVEEA